MAASAAISPTGGEVKDLYEMGEIPPLGHVPAKMYAWAIRRERHGPPEQSHQLEVLPVWELTFDNLPDSHAAIATARVKHDLAYQERWGINQQPARELPPALVARLHHTSKRIYRALELDGYARVDFRLQPDGRFFFLEANPNPEIAEREEFASAALAAGLSYPALLTRILRLALARTGPSR